VAVRRVCLYSVAIGKEHQAWYAKTFGPSHRRFAAFRGWDYHLVTDHLTPETSHPNQVSIQKLLAPSLEPLSHYDWLVYVDTDVFARWRSSDRLLDTLSPKQVYLVDEATQPSPDKRMEWARGWGLPDSPTKYYAQFGFDGPTNEIFNTGVMVFSPDTMRETFRQLYQDLAILTRDHPRPFHLEQASIAHVFWQEGLIGQLDARWNRLWPLINETQKPATRFARWRLLDNSARESVFLHFAAQTWRGLSPELAVGNSLW